MDVTAYDWYYRDYAFTDSDHRHRRRAVRRALRRHGRHAPMATSPGSRSRGAAGRTYLSDDYAYDSNPSETGLLLVTNADRGDYRGGAPIGRESILLNVIDPRADQSVVLRHEGRGRCPGLRRMPGVSVASGLGREWPLLGIHEAQARSSDSAFSGVTGPCTTIG